MSVDPAAKCLCRRCLEAHPIAETALLAAEFRANESEREDALFSDPFARMLAGERGATLAARAKGRAVWECAVAIRTRVIDDLLLGALSEAAIDVVVNLGAGLDTRPYRLAIPASTRWIEVDQPEILAYKAQILGKFRPQCTCEQRAFDVADDLRRRDLLHELASAGSVLVIAEGILGYLSGAAVGAIARDLNAAPNVCSWIFDHPTSIQSALIARAWGIPDAEPVPNDPFAPEDIGAFFEPYGWSVKRSHPANESAAAYGRVPSRADAIELLPFLPVPEAAAAGHWRSGCVLLTRS